MKTVTVLGVSLVIGAELLVLLARQRQLLLPVSGIALMLLLVSLRRLLQYPDDRYAAEPDRDDTLRRWLSSSETRIHWSETTRRDWDRHWRPVLARRFAVTAGRHAKDRHASAVIGEMVFGAALWEWVDPGNVVPGGDQQPGPGRVALEEILQRLEQT